jgi:hypothetical protein
MELKRSASQKSDPWDEILSMIYEHGSLKLVQVSKLSRRNPRPMKSWLFSIDVWVFASRLSLKSVSFFI